MTCILWSNATKTVNLKSLIFIGPGGNELRTTFNKEWIFSYLDGGYAQGAGTTIYGGNTGAAG